jgi:lysozyme
MKVQQSTIDLIKSFEGFKSKPYSDGTNHYAIGYGTSIEKHVFDTWDGKSKITQIQAEQYLSSDLENNILPYLNRLFPVQLHQNKIDALCSLVYNVGHIGGLLVKAILNNNIPLISAQWLMYVHSNGITIPGLLKRRKRELELFLSK